MMGDPRRNRAEELARIWCWQPCCNSSESDLMEVGMVSELMTEGLMAL